MIDSVQGAAAPVTEPKPAPTAKAPPDPPPPPAHGADRVSTTAASAKPLHLIFFADTHSRMSLIDRFVADANARQPDLLIDGGDRVHDGTEPEFQRTGKALAALQAPLHQVEGNHDADLRGPFTEPLPQFPTFQSFDQQGVHVILLDNSDETLSDEQFAQLETDLAANQGKTTIVAMHVPALLSQEKLTTKLSQIAPIKFASPTMHDPAQVERFTALMSKHQVAAVLAGHTHHPDEVVQDGVRYITAGAVGGQTPGLGIAQEYLDIHVTGRTLDVERVKLADGPKNPFSFAAGTCDFYKDLNQANHQAIGWTYTPSVSVQVRSGLRVSETSRGTSVAGGLTASLENTKPKHGAIFGEATLAAGPRELSADLVGGYKHRLTGDYNRNAYVSGGVGLNGGIIADKLSAGVGARVGVGGEYKRWTFEVGHERATNRNMTTATIGFRF
jgi:predicted phosphodiesterase